MRHGWLVWIALLALGGCVTREFDAPVEAVVDPVSTIPDHPDALVFEPQTIEFPDPATYRHVLATGDVVYVVEDHSLPLVDISIHAPGGDYLLAADQAGLAAMTATMLRDGGTRELSPAELDEELEFLATNIGFAIGAVTASASVDTLSENLDRSMDLLFDLLVEPAWDAERLAINRDQLVEAMRRRNDDTRSIEPRIWSDLLYGEEFFVTQRATLATVAAIDDRAMAALRDRIFASGRLIIAVSGDVDTESMLTRLETQLGRLPRADEPLPPVPEDPQPAAAGLYGVAKSDVTQTRVSLGHPTLRRGHPDEFALAVMNEILGGGGFTSRVVSRVRSDEGLAYSAGTGFSLGRFFPGQFRAWFQSNNAAVPRALAIVLEEIRRIRNTLPGEEELETAKASQLAFLADLYSSAGRMATRFAADELDERPVDYWREYEQRVRSVTPADVQRVARAHLHEDQLRILVVGDLEAAMAGEADFGTLEAVVDRSLVRIPLKDPLTLE